MTGDLKEFRATELSEADRARESRHEVGRDIVAACHRRGDFLLASGERTNFYFDKYLFETKPTILRRLGDMLAEQVAPDVDRLAGVEVGGVALAAAVSLATGLPFVILRRASGLSLHDRARGEIHRGERVMLIEDVVDSGAQAIDAASTLASLGANVAGVLAVIDREAGGGRALAAAGLHYTPMYTLGDLDIGDPQ